MSATINYSKYVIFGSGFDYTLNNSGTGDGARVFSHPYVPLNSVNYAGQYYFLVPDADGEFFDAVKDDVAHCTFTPSLGTAFSTEGETTVKVKYRREYSTDEGTILIEKTVEQNITVVNHGTVSSSGTNFDIYSDGYCFVRPNSISVIEEKKYAGITGSFTKISSIPWRSTGLGNGIIVFTQSSSLADISELEYADTSNCMNLENLFKYAPVSDISALENWDVSNVTKINYFGVYSGIKDLSALAKWDVSSVTDLKGAFFQMRELEDISGLANWDVSNVTTLEYAFTECDKLQDITALEKWDISSVTSLKDTFSSCTALTSLEGLEEWDVSSVTNMSGMCNKCYAVASLEPLSEWTAQPTSLNSTFAKCTSLQSLSGIENIDTSECVNMESTFEGCSKLLSLDGVESWDTSKVISFYRTFTDNRWVHDISAVDSWSFASATNCQRMFSNIDAISDVDDVTFDLSNVQNATSMFASEPFGYSEDIGEYVYKAEHFWYTYSGDSYSELAITVTEYSKDASNAENWTVSGTNLGIFSNNVWVNIPSWN